MQDGSILAPEKARIRKLGRLARQGIGPSERRGADEAIQGRLLGAPWFERAATVGGYMALPGEVPLDDVLGHARRRGAAIVLPRWDGSQLTLAYDDGLRREPGRWRVLEPTGTVVCESGAGWVVLIPGIAFDGAGGRVGRGGGWYDRLLAAYPDAYRVGVAYEAQVISRVPLASWDVPMQAIVTEARVRLMQPMRVSKEGESPSWMF